jgi:DNA invertase Pin-like site-specific DNA recombinase
VVTLYYTKYIQSNPAWEFIKVYCDEGITATNTKHRDGFNEMVQDALDGKLDYILTKSVSRFARNTVDSLTVIRQLKEKGVFVYFEKDYIKTSIIPCISRFYACINSNLTLISRL